jgi:hypothetical protein
MEHAEPGESGSDDDGVQIRHVPAIIRAVAGFAGHTPVSARVPAMLESGMAPLRDLELMIQSHYPLIAIETSEEARLERILSEVATSLQFRSSCGASRPV